MRQKILARGVKEDRMVIIPNWADGKQICPLERSGNKFVEKRYLADKFIVECSGHMGEGHDFSTILQAAKRLKEYRDLVFLYIGNGPKRGEIAEFKEKHKLGNVSLLPYQDRTDLRFSLGAADVTLISFKSNLESLMFPCKVYGIVASGRPFIYVGGKP